MEPSGINMAASSVLFGIHAAKCFPGDRRKVLLSSFHLVGRLVFKTFFIVNGSHTAD
jgi:hypothetical protein